MQRDTLEFDFVIVGGGPAGLATACRLGQLGAERGLEQSVCVLEKGSEIGAHVMSGAVLEPRALTELFPDWQSRGAPVSIEVENESLHWLAGGQRSLRVPNALLPLPMRNEGNYVVSLGRLCRWMAEQAETLGVDLFPGYPAVDITFGDDGSVAGVVTGDMGVAADGTPKAAHEPGIEIKGRRVIFAEGCRGHLGRRLERHFELRSGVDPQHYGIGLKEIWSIAPERHRPGTILHTIGWPLDRHTDGGGFLYHAADNLVYVGLIVGLNYTNPYLSPFDEFQRFKQHPLIRSVLEGGKRQAYGARAVNKGGWPSLPRVTFPGGMLVGCDAGLLNPAKIKGIHAAIKSGMLAAESAFATVHDAQADAYQQMLADSWLGDELRRARNFSPAVAKLGPLVGGAVAFAENNLLRGRAPYTLRNPVPDHGRLRPAAEVKPLEYPAPDGVLSFDRLSSVFLSNTNHEEDQPTHLELGDPTIPIAKNLPIYAEPAQRYCPAGVYEIVESDGGEPRFQINAQNCVHCKTCDIKDPAQNITWVPPEGGGGPNYTEM